MLSTSSSIYTSSNAPSLEDDHGGIPDDQSVRTSAASLPDAIPFSQMSGSSNGRALFANPFANRAQSTESDADVTDETDFVDSADSAERDAHIIQWTTDGPWNALALNTVQDHASTKASSLAEQIVENLPAERDAEDSSFDLHAVPEDELLAFVGSGLFDYRAVAVRM